MENLVAIIMDEAGKPAKLYGHFKWLLANIIIGEVNIHVKKNKNSIVLFFEIMSLGMFITLYQ